MDASKSFVSITFDDGRKEQFTTFHPILNEYNLKATFYIVTHRINWNAVISWNELKAIYENGHEIGSHTHTHPHLTQLSDAQLDYELKRSYEMLRPFNCCTLAYPYGEYDERVVENAKKYFLAARGYYNPKMGTGSLGLNFDPNQDRYNLKNFPMEHSIPSECLEPLGCRSLFGLPFSEFKQSLKQLVEYSMKRNAWIIFTIHGTYHGTNVSWFSKNPVETAEYFVVRLTSLSSINDFVRERALRKDKILKFKWMCKYLAQNDQIESLPVSQVIRKYIAD